VLDVALDRLERRGSGWRVVGQGTTRSGPFDLEVDDVIAATGFTTPLLDLPQLGVRTVSDGRIPALTPFWESEPGSGIYFAGNATQGAPGLRKHGIGASSPAVHGFRYNARIMARNLAETHLGLSPPRARLDPARTVPFLLEELTRAPELWTQKSYLTRTVTAEGDTDVVPLAHFLDARDADAVAVTVEMNAGGDVYPAVYVRRGARVRERLLGSHALNDFRGPEYEQELAALL
jgi:hypothetical protein